MIRNLRTLVHSIIKTNQFRVLVKVMILLCQRRLFLRFLLLLLMDFHRLWPNKELQIFRKLSLCFLLLL